MNIAMLPAAWCLLVGGRAVARAELRTARATYPSIVVHDRRNWP